MPTSARRVKIPPPILANRAMDEAPMAKPLSDQDIENLAAYFASQKQK